MALKLRGARIAKKKELETAANTVENDAFQEQGKKVVLEHPYFIFGCVGAIIVVVIVAMLISSAVKSSSDAKSLEYAAATELLDKADDDNSENAKAAYEKALEAFDKVIQNQSGSMNAAASMVISGRIYKEKMNNCDKAVDFFKQARNSRQLGTDISFVAYEGEAMCYFDKGDYEKAAELWKEWLNQKTDIYKDYALYYVGMTYEKLGKTDEASVYYNRLKDEYPTSLLLTKITGKVTTTKEPEKAQN
ncbi:tetratricopeptide repeat protein [bacterium]|nr:tetratricopeptide repeat protein [bacterium]